MLETIDLPSQQVDGYKPFSGDEAVDHLRTLAEPLQGARILHLNATQYGGGVAELLRSEIPLFRGLGLKADWSLIPRNDRFFQVTKAIHNGLQGAPQDLTAEQWDIYLEYSGVNAQLLEEEYDLVVVHDPQPVAVPSLRGKGNAKWIWRCHLDTSQPNPAMWNRLRNFVAEYDAAVFTLGGFVPPDLPVDRVEIIPPAIDPLSPKNIAIDSDLTSRVLTWIGIDLDQPLIAQISRFDPWKDPFGVIATYKLIKESIPNVQLALVASMALDDPEGWDMFREISAAVKQDPDIGLYTNLTGVSNIEVNAFQRHANVVIQKSIREGFGLVVSEALWKGTPVVAGRAGGIPLQLQDGVSGYLVDSVEECAQRALELLKDQVMAREMGQAGLRQVRERFLFPRLLADELRLYSSLLTDHITTKHGHAGAGLAGELRDPVCGLRLSPDTPITVTHNGVTHYFCSQSCRHQFLANPQLFLRATTT